MWLRSHFTTCRTQRSSNLRFPTTHLPCIIDFVNITLTPTEARVLGALAEKEITTPEYYPLSLNAIVNACNQKSNRDPVMALDEDAVRQALHALDKLGLARSAATDSRVAKFEHRLQDVFNFHRHEIALLCVLLLRGPQTPGELRTRTDRLYQFDDLSSVHTALNLLMKREPPLVKVLPRQPGTKEARYVHLLSAPPADFQEFTASSEALDHTSPADWPLNATAERVAQLEEVVAALRAEIADLKQQFVSFQKQFQ